MQFGALSPSRTPELIRFLAGVFGSSESLSFRSDLIDWKYFEPHPWWPESRSYLIDTDQGIAAHGCVVPVRYSTGSGTVESMQIIDWAANNLAPGGGLLIYRRCLELGGGTLLAIGGSDDTRRIIPKLKWFERKEDLRMYARPLRFWRYRKADSGMARNLGRMGRNFAWQISARLPKHDDWSCRTVIFPDRVFMPEGNFVPILRTPEWFAYLLRCPVFSAEFVAIEKKGVPVGHALVSNANGSMRIADFVVKDADRCGALAALIRYVAGNPTAAEVVAGSSLPELWPVFESCGLRLRENVPVYVADPKTLMPAGAPLEVAPMIGDSYSLYDPAWPFRC
jgi:hypothetical protein